MPNARIDDNGVPKGAVYEQTPPLLHRAGIDEVDETAPELEDAVDAAGYEHVDFDLDVTLGGDDPLLEVTVLHYGAAAEAWFRGGAVVQHRERPVPAPHRRTRGSRLPRRHRAGGRHADARPRRVGVALVTEQ